MDEGKRRRCLSSFHDPFADTGEGGVRSGLLRVDPVEFNGASFPAVNIPKPVSR